jgi:hypothetical protein
VWSGDQFLYDIKGGSLRSSPAHGCEGWLALASSPAPAPKQASTRTSPITCVVDARLERVQLAA